MRKPEFVYVTYIETTPEKLWEALTDERFHRTLLVGAPAEIGLEGRLVVRDAATATAPSPMPERSSNMIGRGGSSYTFVNISDEVQE